MEEIGRLQREMTQFESDNAPNSGVVYAADAKEQ